MSETEYLNPQEGSKITYRKEPYKDYLDIVFHNFLGCIKKDFLISKDKNGDIHFSVGILKGHYTDDIKHCDYFKTLCNIVVKGSELKDMIFSIDSYGFNDRQLSENLMREANTLTQLFFKDTFLSKMWVGDKEVDGDTKSNFTHAIRGILYALIIDVDLFN